MDELDTASQRITRSYPTSLGDIRDDLKKQILLNHTGSRSVYNQIPLVHGRSAGARLDGASGNNATSAAGAAKGGRATAGGQRRMANHQRNLSLDFRSMGIVLPPVSQVTNTRVNLTQHHRNRSLDSALQGIPEVEVSSPSAELEKTICTNSLYGAAMCSKISTSLCNTSGSGQQQHQQQLQRNLIERNSTGSVVVGVSESSNCEFGDWSGNSDCIDKPRGSSSSDSAMPKPAESSINNNRAGEDHIDGGGVMGVPVVMGGEVSVVTVPNKSSSLLKKKTKMTPEMSSVAAVKKRDDLACLGSDDSGIICNSEHEHPQPMKGGAGGGGSGKKRGASRDSISSAGDEMIEEHEDEDEMFSQEGGDDEDEEEDRGIMSRTPSEEAEEEEHDTEERESIPRNPYGVSERILLNSNNAKDGTVTSPSINSPSPEGPLPTNAIVQQQNRNGRGLTTGNGLRLMSPTRSDHYEVTSPGVTGTAIVSGKDHKNDVMFKNFFGATKNAIFRTAQSIIENHEKKSSSKNKMSIDLGGNSTSGQEEDSLSPLSSNATPTQLSNANTPTPTTTPVVLSPVADQAPTVIAAPPKKREFFTLKPKMPVFHLSAPKQQQQAVEKKLPGTVQQYVIKESSREEKTAVGRPTKADHNGLLRFFESPIFNIHFAVHYLFYSKEPGVLMFIANKIFSFPDEEVDLYMPQLVLMYTQMDELADILDSYLVYRCRKSVDFSLKCAWLLESYNLNVLEAVAKQSSALLANKVSRLYLLRELYPKREKRLNMAGGGAMDHHQHMLQVPDVQSPLKKTHHRSQSDATGLLGGGGSVAIGGAGGTVGGGVVSGDLLKNSRLLGLTPKPLALGDLTSGRAFDNGCLCFVTVRGTVNDLRGQKTVCSCGAPKLLPEREFMKILIDIGRTLTSLPTKSEKTTALRMFLNQINKNLPARVWLPLYSEIPHHVVRITEDKTAVLNSKDKTPYIIYVEVVEVNDIYTSPVMPKLMPTLRHTKSEEHLEMATEGESGSAASKGESVKQQGAGNSGGHLKRDLLRASLNGNGPSSHLRPEDGEDLEKSSNKSSSESGFDLRIREDDVWSQEDDEITAQYVQMQKLVDRDAVSQLSMDSCDSKDQGAPVLFNIRDVRNRHCVNLNVENTKTFSNDPEDPSAAALKEPWDDKEKQIRQSSPYGHLPNWRLLSVIVKSGDDLRQELMATQLLQMFKLIWDEESVDLWVRPYKIVCLSNDSGLIEPILNTVSIHQIKKNSNKSLKEYFVDEYGDPEGERFGEAQRKFMQSCAAYCLISYLLQVKDRHNGNILLHSDGHLIHIDFGFILSISPKNLGFEQSPFKLTPEFVDVMGGPTSELWIEFKYLLLRGLLTARKHMERIINIVEIMRSSSQLPCFKNGCSTTVRNLRNRFHMGLTEQELERKVEQLIQDSLNSLSTKLYDGYQYYTNGIL